MSQPHAPSPTGKPRVAEFHLLGEVDFEAGLQLQRRLVYEAARDRSGKLVVLLCEHPSLITIGRHGSRGHVRLTTAELERERLAVRWVKRGGGAILHGPGQLAVYGIAHLAAHGWSVGDYLNRLRRGVWGALESLGIHPQARVGSYGVWGRSGLLAATGVAVQHGTTSQGIFVNVHPAMSRFGYIDTATTDGPAGKAPMNGAPMNGATMNKAPMNKATMSCLLAERRQALRMSTVRSTLVDQLADAFGCDQHYIHSGHRWLRTGISSEHVARAC